MATPKQIIRVDVADLTGCIIESIFFGLFAVVGTSALYILAERHGRIPYRINIILFAATAIMLILAFTHLVVDVHRIFEAFLDRTFEQRVAYLQSVTVRSYAARNAIFITMTLVGDAVLMYRVYAVWGNIWVMLAPTIFSLGSAVGGYGSIYEIQHVSGNPLIYSARLGAWVHAFIACSLAANVTATSLIAGRIWWSHRRAQQYMKQQDGGGVWSVLYIIIESGALNALTFIGYEICLALKTNVLKIFSNFIVPITGLTFALVICRVYSAKAILSSGPQLGSHHGPTTVHTAAGGSRVSRGQLASFASATPHTPGFNETKSYEMKPVEINVHRFVEAAAEADDIQRDLESPRRKVFHAI